MPPRKDSSTLCMSSACPPEDGYTRTPRSDAPSTDLGRRRFLLFALKGKTRAHDNCRIIPISSTLWWWPASVKVSVPTSMNNFQGIVSTLPVLSADHIAVICSGIPCHQLTFCLLVVSWLNAGLQNILSLCKVPIISPSFDGFPALLSPSTSTTSSHAFPLLSSAQTLDQ